MQNIAYGVLWILVITLAISVLRIRNQVYMPQKLTELLFADNGAPLGHEFPVTYFNTIIGEQAGTRDQDGKKTILLITSPTCSACKALYPLITPFIQRHGDQYRLISLMYGELHEIEIIRNSYNFNYPIVRITDEDLNAIQTKRFPFGYLLSPDGKVVSKGLVTNEEQFNLLRTWVPKQSKKNRFAFYREKTSAEQQA
ncbi:hypothetical protein H8B09_14355 [Paenibacillus sp. PR3]|uniref:Thioredoxin domain-containing protein n=1 Tax=Paenibacillus terricola TaxID=2763503 RepID=A0ABR8MY10_9BACL|nr:hypothetical protein [Paenibacillus terricola]MBD3919942.1 hypothetical protein [Paenibacillus terricola]